MEKKTENEMETREFIGIIGVYSPPLSRQGLYWDNGKEKGNYYLGFRVLGIVLLK